MKVSVQKPGSPSEILEHHGVKGQKWGVRNKSTSSGGSSGGRVKRFARRVGAAADNTSFILGTTNAHIQTQIASNASSKLVKDLPSIKARHGAYGKLSNRAKKPFSKEARAYRSDVKKTYLGHLEKSANEMTNIRGTLKYTLQENGKPNTSAYFWHVSVTPVQHADTSFIVQPIFDNEGWIVDIKSVDKSMAQVESLGRNFLIHHEIMDTKI